MTAVKQGADDHIFVLIGLVLVASAVLLASSVPFIVTVWVLLLRWFFGGPRRVALLAGLAGVANAAFAFTVGGGLAFFHELAKYYAVTIHDPNPFEPITLHWLLLVCERSAWIFTAPIGLVGASIWLLLTEDLKHSPRHQVFVGPQRARPAPWARLRTWSVMNLAAIWLRSSITLGAEISTGRRIRITTHELARHLIVVGRSGRGKTETVCAIASEAARLGIPIVYVDGKNDRSVQKLLAEIAAARSRNFHLFDAMRPEISCAYDAFKNRNITTQKDLVIGLRAMWTEPHYKTKAGAFAQVTFEVLRYGAVDADLHTFARNLSVNSLLALARRLPDKEGGYDRIKKKILNRRKDETAAVDSLLAEVSVLTDAHFGELLDVHAARLSQRPILNLADARKGGEIVYFGLPALSYPDAAAKLAALVIGDLKASLPDSETQWLLIFDEFSIFASAATLNLINQGRTYRASAVLATQSFSDFLTSDSKAFLRQVVGSANTFLVHELTDPEDAELAAALFGTKFATQYTAQIVDSLLTGSASAKGVYEFKVHPDQVKNLGLGEVFVLNKDKPGEVSHALIKRAHLRK